MAIRWQSEAHSACRHRSSRSSHRAPPRRDRRTGGQPRGRRRRRGRATRRRRRRGGGEAEGDDGAEPPLPGIGPHVDNGSCVTLIAMLSDRARGDFEGGVNRFEDGAGRGGIDDGRFVELRPELGDIVIFRGEACEHSLTPVTRGVRRILQIEFCRMKEGRH